MGETMMLLRRVVTRIYISYIVEMASKMIDTSFYSFFFVLQTVLDSCIVLGQVVEHSPPWPQLVLFAPSMFFFVFMRDFS